MHNETLLTSSAVAKLIDRSPDRVRQLTRAGRLVPVFVTSRGDSLFTNEEVDRYQRESERGASRN